MVGLVLTNSYFTKSAIDLAASNSIILIDRDKLEKMIQKLNHSNPNNQSYNSYHNSTNSQSNRWRRSSEHTSSAQNNQKDTNTSQHHERANQSSQTDHRHFTDTASGTLDFFINCKSLEDVKQRYKHLMKIYHPDIGGDEQFSQTINNQYEKAKAKYS